MSDMGSICIFGASTTWGAYDLEKGGWANRLRLFVDAGDFEPWEVYVLGVCGDTTRELLERFEAEAAAREPGVVIFSIGVNDAAYRNTDGNFLVPPEEFRGNIRKLAERARKFTEKVAFMGTSGVDEIKTMPIPWRKDIFYTNTNLRAYDEALREVVAESGAQYIPPPTLAADSDFEDGLHPNAKGHERIFCAVRDFLLDAGWLRRMENQ